MRRLLLGLTLLATWVAAAPAQAAQNDLTPAAEQTFSQMAGCVASSGQTNILLVVDESQSLEASDPDSRRSDALRVALTGVTDLQRAAPDKKIMVAASSFATDYTERIGWRQATPETVGQLEDFATNEVPSLRGGQGTDYRKALSGAREQLRAAGDGCRIVLWFTDGGLDVGSSSDAEKAAAFEEICAPSGIADSLRSEQIFVVAVALFNPDVAAITDTDRQRLQDIAEGAASGLSDCGTSPLPADFARGAYLPASDASRLAEIFGSAVSRIGGYTMAGRVLCPSAQCLDGLLDIPVDPGIERVRLSAYATDATSPTLTLTPPGGTPVALAEDVAKVGEAPAQVTTAGAATQVDLTTSDAAASGTWVLQVSGGSAWVQTWYSSGVSFVLADPQQSVSAEQATDVAISATHGDGSAVDLADFDTEGLTVSMDGQSLEVAQGDGAAWTVTVPALEGSILPRKRTLTTELRLVTTASGIVLDPVEQQFALPVTTSAAYPTVLSDSLRFPDSTTAGEVSADLQVRGAQTGPSQVCVAGTSFTGPGGQVPLTGPQECLDLAANETRALPFTADVETIRDGQIDGVVDVTLRSGRPGDEPLTVAVPATMSLTRPVDVARFTMFGLLFVLAAILLPLAIIYGIGKWLLAKFVPGQLRYCAVPVVVHKSATGEYSLRTPDDPGLDIAPEALRWRHVPAKATAVDVGGLMLTTDFALMRTRALGSVRIPWLAVDATATARLQNPRGRVVVSNKNPYGLDPQSAPADLRLERNWFLVADADSVDPEEGFQAELVAFGMGPGFPHAEMSDRTPTVLVDRMVAALRKAAGECSRQRPAAPAQPVRAPTTTTRPTTTPDDWL